MCARILTQRKTERKQIEDVVEIELAHDAGEKIVNAVLLTLKNVVLLCYAGVTVKSLLATYPDHNLE